MSRVCITKHSHVPTEDHQVIQVIHRHWMSNDPRHKLDVVILHTNTFSLYTRPPALNQHPSHHILNRV